jgi:hypothetical protein
VPVRRVPAAGHGLGAPATGHLTAPSVEPSDGANAHYYGEDRSITMSADYADWMVDLWSNQAAK